MNFVMDLEVEDFTLLVEQMLKKKHDDLEVKREERFFNIWGYQLPIMKEPLNYHEFKKKYYNKTTTNKRTQAKKNKKENKKLIDRIEKIKEKHQAGK